MHPALQALGEAGGLGAFVTLVVAVAVTTPAPPVPRFTSRPAGVRVLRAAR